MQIRLREDGRVMFWSDFRELLLAQDPSRLIKVAEETEAWINENGADIIYYGQPPSPGKYEIGVEDGIEQDEKGLWVRKYKVVPMSAEQMAAVDEMQAEVVRANRNIRIAQLDWTQGKDIPDSISGPAAVVRQALRDVPTQAGFPWNINWPTYP